MILDDIVAATKERVKRDLETDTLLKLEARLPDDKQRPFAAALKHPDRLGLIAEIKKASPSKEYSRPTSTRNVRPNSIATAAPIA
jgi:indole-3-glycerol phosphate synthase